MSDPIDFGPADMLQERPNLVVIRFKEGSVASPAIFTASIEARRTHFGDRPHGVLILAPDDSDFEPSFIGKDQYKDQGVEDFTLALAFVCRNPTVMNIVEMYHARHPTPFPSGLFREEKEARAWMDAQLAELGK
jgi:hypothetical protein